MIPRGGLENQRVEWARGPIFGKVRYMNDAGLSLKFDIDAYVRLFKMMSQKAG